VTAGERQAEGQLNVRKVRADVGEEKIRTDGRKACELSGHPPALREAPLSPKDPKIGEGDFSRKKDGGKEIWALLASVPTEVDDACPVLLCKGHLKGMTTWGGTEG